MKVTNLMTLACLLGTTACTETATVPPDQTGPAGTVQRKFISFDDHDAATIQEIYAVDAVLHSPDYPELKGNAGIADTYRQLFSAIPDAKDEVLSFDVIGNKVYVQFALTGHFGGTAGKPIRVPIMSIYTVQDGHIVADTTYYDRKTL